MKTIEEMAIEHAKKWPPPPLSKDEIEMWLEDFGKEVRDAERERCAQIAENTEEDAGVGSLIDRIASNIRDGEL